MAEFGFNEGHEILRRSVKEFAEKELLPGVKTRAVSDRIPGELIKKIAKMGYLSSLAPKEYGGEELDKMSLGIIIEELGKVDRIAAHIVMIPGQFIIVLNQGTKAQKDEWMLPTMRGEVTASFCITEPDCGTDAQAIKCSAVRDGDNYVITGEKCGITRGMQANVLLVWAKTNPEAGARGVSCFIVPSDSPGISRRVEEDMGMRALQRATISFDGVRVPARYRIGEEGKGFYLVMQRFDVIRVLLCLIDLGQAHASLHEAIEYSKQRHAFGRPIAKFEAVSFKIAEDLTLLDAGRLMCYRALWMADQGVRHTKESAMCKWVIPQWAAKIDWDSILIFGHYGYGTDLPIQQRFRDTLGMQLGDGTAEAQKLAIVREVLGREYMPY